MCTERETEREYRNYNVHCICMEDSNGTVYGIGIMRIFKNGWGNIKAESGHKIDRHK